MGKTILTPKQSQFLECVSKDGQITKSCKKYGYSLDKLILTAKAKFDWHIDRITLASQFIKVTDFDESSMMIIPLNKKDMDKFFLSLARSLKGEILK